MTSIDCKRKNLCVEFIDSQSVNSSVVSLSALRRTKVRNHLVENWLLRRCSKISSIMGAIKFTQAHLTCLHQNQTATGCFILNSQKSNTTTQGRNLFRFHQGNSWLVATLGQLFHRQEAEGAVVCLTQHKEQVLLQLLDSRVSVKRTHNYGL